MSKTIRQIADELGVSKPTISRAIADLGIEPHKVGNRFELSDDDIDRIKTQISKIGETPQSQISPQSQNEKTQKSQHETERSIISLLETQISLLQEQLTVKDTQLFAKDEQIRGQQAQIEQLTASLQQQTSALENTTAALTAAQALHAADKKTLMLIENQENEHKLSFWERLAAKKAEKKVRKEQSENRRNEE